METSDVCCCLHFQSGRWACLRGIRASPQVSTITTTVTTVITLSQHHRLHHRLHHQLHRHLYSTTTFFSQFYISVNTCIISLGVTTTAIVTNHPHHQIHYSQSSPRHIFTPEFNNSCQPHAKPPGLFILSLCLAGADREPWMASVLILWHMKL